ncbi:MAG: hypothetical protein H6739_08780 [Alphaproteobacteria bacterium]|nr:hypothetical protein [Alphaproteobacteria bacterium]
MSLDVLLQGPEGEAINKEEGLPDIAAGEGGRPGKVVTVTDPDHLGTFSGPNDMDQGWGILYPAGREDLLSALEPLIKLRERQIADRWTINRQIGDPPKVQRWPIQPTTDSTTFLATVYDKLKFRDQPMYLLILGDFHEVGLEMQQGLMSRCYVGRLCFDSPDDYRAYAEKVKATEETPAAFNQPRLVLYSTSDSGWGRRDRAVDSGHAQLIVPTHKDFSDFENNYGYATTDVLLAGPRAPRAEHGSWDGLRKLARADQPTVMLSLSHGAGLPGWDKDEQRAMQGRMKLSGREMLDLSHLSESPFLPNGVWFYYACFGAGTPHNSVYAPWLRKLASTGYWGRVPDVLSTLARDEQPFVARQPKVALANPEGPLGVYAHADIAFSYGYSKQKGQDLFTTDDPDVFEASGKDSAPGYVRDVLGALGAGLRTGLALRYLTNILASVDDNLLKGYQTDAELEDKLVRKVLEAAAQPSGPAAEEDAASRIFNAVRGASAELGNADRMTLDAIAEVSKVSVTELVDAFGTRVDEARREAARLDARSHNWMTRNDLRGFILLGDPAASLALPTIRPERTLSQDDLLNDVLGGFVSRPPSDVAPAPEPASDAGPVTDAATALSASVSLDDAEDAVLDAIIGEETRRSIAKRLGIKSRELDELIEVYKNAGRAALKQHLG